MGGATFRGPAGEAARRVEMGTGVYGIGVRALSAAQLGVITAQHNIANASTPGFHRQEVVQSTALPYLTGAGWVGQGGQIDTIKRVYSEFLDKQVLTASTQASYYESFYAQIKQLDNLVADPNAGLSPALQDFFSSVQAVANDPSSAAARQSMLSSAQALVTRFQSMYERMAEIRDGVDTQIGSAVSSINALAAQIAIVNERIVIAQASNSHSPNDLLDQRDHLIAQLNEQIRATVVKQSDGTYNVFIGNGQPLVVGSTAYALQALQDPLDPEQMVVGYAIGNSTVMIRPESLTGGVLGGLLAFRSGALESAQNALGRVAIGLVDTFNDQHRLGQDLNGALGGNFFNLANTSPTLYPSTGNTGTATVSATLAADAGALTTSSYRLTYDAGSSSYTLLKLDDGSTTTFATFPQTIDGVTLSLSSGTPNDGDKWLITPTRFGARDISVAITDVNRIAAAAPIRTAATAGNAGDATISAGAVTATTNLPTATVTLTYNSGTQTFTTSSADPVWNGLTLPGSGTYASGATISVNGISFAISGSPANGDSFTIAPNVGGVGDNRNALLLAQLQTRNTLANNAAGTPTTTFQGAYSQMVGAVGTKTREMQVSYQSQTTLLQQTQRSQQALSGVNLDEEAAALIRFQQAYQAAARMIQVGNVLFDTLLELR